MDRTIRIRPLNNKDANTRLGTIPTTLCWHLCRSSEARCGKLRQGIVSPAPLKSNIQSIAYIYCWL